MEMVAKIDLVLFSNRFLEIALLEPDLDHSMTKSPCASFLLFTCSPNLFLICLCSEAARLTTSFM
jgi:hypothetical protein